MTDVRAVHPGTGALIVVDSEALDHHLRQSGWLTETEHLENQAAAAAAADAAAAAAAKTAAKEAKAS